MTNMKKMQAGKYVYLLKCMDHNSEICLSGTWSLDFFLKEHIALQWLIRYMLTFM